MMELSVGMMSYVTYVQVDNATFPKYISEVTLKEWGKQDSTTNAIDNVQMKASARKCFLSDGHIDKTAGAC